MRIEQDGDTFNIKLSSYEMGVISDLISDGVTYNRAENYEMKKSNRHRNRPRKADNQRRNAFNGI